MNVTRGALKVEGDGVKTCVSTKNERRVELRPSAKRTLQFEPRSHFTTYKYNQTPEHYFVGFLNEKTNLYSEDFQSI